MCFYDYPNLVKLFLKKTNVDINEKFVIIGKQIKNAEEKTYFRDEYKTPLYLSIENENIEIIKLLLSNDNINVNLHSHIRGYSIYNETPFCLAIRKNCTEIVKLLLSNNKLDINLPSQCDGNDKIVYENYDNKSDILIPTKPDKGLEKTPLIYAIINGNIDIIKILISYDILDINKPSKLMKKVNLNPILGPNNRHEMKIDEWIYPDINYEYEYQEIIPLSWAIKSENNEIIKLLLSCEKIDVNLLSYENDTSNNKYKSEKTPLFYAIEKNNIEIVNILLSFEKLNVNLISKQIKGVENEKFIWKWAKTPLYYAVEVENIDIIKILLLHKDIDINYVCIGKKLDDYVFEKYSGVKIEKTAFILAVENENIEIIKLLLSNDKIDVNIPYMYLINEKLKKQTPLHIAVEKNNVTIIKLLLQNKNNNINAEDENGKKPIDMTNKIEIKKILSTDSSYKIP